MTSMEAGNDMGYKWLNPVMEWEISFGVHHTLKGEK